MPLVHMTDMLQHARSHGYAVGAYDLVDTLFLEAILAGVEAVDAPVILSLAESHFAHYDFATLMPAVVGAARRARVPVAIHLDHGASLESARRAIALGANGVMVDASTAPYADNVRLTRSVVAMAHACGVPVEGELGYVAGVEGEDAERHPGSIVYTSPEEAERFVAEAGVDFLAVSIGTVHGRLSGEPRLDFDRLEAIAERVPLPLVIHGGTGLSDAQFAALIARGVAKINYYTALSDAAAATIVEAAKTPGAGYTRLLSGARAAIRAEVERTSRLWGAAGRAPALLAHCRPWQEVEHLILFNFDQGSGDEEVRLSRGRRELATIPGVRRVDVARALTADPRYAYAWLIRFAQREVIASYRDHPVHQTYADGVFRPAARDRLSIDFEIDIPLDADMP